FYCTKIEDKNSIIAFPESFSRENSIPSACAPQWGFHRVIPFLVAQNNAPKRIRRAKDKYS
ncbi:hypothetical protein CEXT_172961, partial [Caerostris extrusa]